MDFDETVQNSKKRDNFNLAIFFIQKPRFRLIGFRSLTFQNPEEEGNKPPNRRFMNKKIV